MKVDRRTFFVSATGTAALGVGVGRAGRRRGRSSFAVAQQGSSQRLIPEALRERANADAEFQIVARHWDARVRLNSGGPSQDVLLRDGKVVGVDAGNSTAADVTI